MEYNNKRKISQTESTTSPVTLDKKRDCRNSPGKTGETVMAAMVDMEIDTTHKSIAGMLGDDATPQNIDVATKICNYLEGMYTKTIQSLVDENKRSAEKIATLESKMTSMESYSRRNNLVISGVPEWCGSNYFELNKWLDEFCALLNITTPHIERIHRVGKPPSGNRNPSFQPRPRPIYVKFSFYKDRMTFWNARFNLKPQAQSGRHTQYNSYAQAANQRAHEHSTNHSAQYYGGAQVPPYAKFVFIAEDFPPEIVEKRQRLQPIAAEARRLNFANGKATVRVDKLILGDYQNSKTYSVDELDKLPEVLIPAANSYRETDQQVSFFRKYCKLSNHNHSPFTLNGQKYSCNEQWFLSQKCIAFKQEEAAKQIMMEDNPGKMVQIAKICNGTNNEWNEAEYSIILQGLEQKFDQNQDCKEFLMKTGTKKLVEGSPYDTNWGVGLRYNDPMIDDEKNWRGTNNNNLGKALMQCRSSLQ